MADFLGNTLELDNQGVKLSLLCRKIAAEKRRVSNVRQCLAKNGKNASIGSMVESSFDFIESSLKVAGKDTQNLCETLDDIRLLYKETESDILDAGKEKSFLEKLLGGSISGAVLSGEKIWTNIVNGVHTSATVSGSLLTGSVNVNGKAEMDLKSNVGISAEIEAGGTLAEGKVSGKYGYLFGNGSVDVVSGKVSGNVEVSLIQDGSVDPQISATASAEAVAVKGEIEAGFGTEENNVYSKATGELGIAKAEAGIQVGKVENAKTGKIEQGVSATASAKATGAKGTIAGGTTICGIKIEA